MVAAETIEIRMSYFYYGNLGNRERKEIVSSSAKPTEKYYHFQLPRIVFFFFVICSFKIRRPAIEFLSGLVFTSRIRLAKVNPYTL